MPFFKKQVNDMEKNALQVPCSCTPAWRKRVLSSASRAAGSLTLEAALALSLFIFASVCLMLPMQKMCIRDRYYYRVMRRIKHEDSKFPGSGQLFTKPDYA